MKHPEYEDLIKDPETQTSIKALNKSLIRKINAAGKDASDINAGLYVSYNNFMKELIASLVLVGHGKSTLETETLRLEALSRAAPDVSNVSILKQP